MSNPPTYPWNHLCYILACLFIAQLATARPQILFSSSTCIDAAGNTYRSGTTVNNQGHLFQVLCGMNILQADLSIQALPSLTLCLDACVGSPYCSGATYEKTVQKCTLKGTQGLLASTLGSLTGLVGSLLATPALIALIPVGIAPLSTSTLVASSPTHVSGPSLPGLVALSSSTALSSSSISESSTLSPVAMFTMPLSRTSASSASSATQDQNLINLSLNIDLASVLNPLASPSPPDLSLPTSIVDVPQLLASFSAILGSVLGSNLAPSVNKPSVPLQSPSKPVESQQPLPVVSLPTLVIDNPQLPIPSVPVSGLGSLPAQSIVSVLMSEPSSLPIVSPTITPSPTGLPIEPSQLDQMLSYLYYDLGIQISRESLVKLLPAAWLTVPSATPTTLRSGLVTTTAVLPLSSLPPLAISSFGGRAFYYDEFNFANTANLECREPWALERDLGIISQCCGCSCFDTNDDDCIDKSTT
ncbi:hypothetical protein P280DRAFT_516695 [Massarina eburnea CBS 473.64]|uniref:Apple domain-containing protein n=1 Tax=Massarina eburnea CBS 473.64 TaxID=1395130 RepID=A0A6A6S684_9PLEO|nr:hypothetical protein P280DRAFT_516695 [Massarina eburnea CBS 473.64]